MAKEKKEVLTLRTWYSNRYQMVLAQKKLLSMFSILAMITVVIAVVFVKKFTESKSFEPYLIEMEEKTGKLNVIENLNNSKLTADEAIKKFYINSFLEAAEGYDFNLLQQDKKKILLLTNTSVFRTIFKRYSEKNEEGVLVKMGTKGVLTVKIKSIVFLTPIIASVRFVVFSNKPSITFPVEKHLIANIEFNFFDLGLSQDDRFINPLGFQVTKYNVGEDVNI